MRHGNRIAPDENTYKLSVCPVEQDKVVPLLNNLFPQSATRCCRHLNGATSCRRNLDSASSVPSRPPDYFQGRFPSTMRGRRRSIELKVNVQARGTKRAQMLSKFEEFCRTRRLFCVTYSGGTGDPSYCTLIGTTIAMEFCRIQKHNNK